MGFNYEFLLVEPIAKTPYPPLGLMKISSMLKDKYKGCSVYTQIGIGRPEGLNNPFQIWITSLFTWDNKHVIECIKFYSRTYPKSEIRVGGIGVSLIEDELEIGSNVNIHKGLYLDAEFYSPDYTATFGRKLNTSISLTSRGCKRGCGFCSVGSLEPKFFVRDNWEKDINTDLRYITMWDNNFLQSPNFEKDCLSLASFNKTVDFNQGIDARLYDTYKAELLSKIKLNPIRFAFDKVEHEKPLIDAISLVRKHSNAEIRVYVLYNFDDSPEELYYRINVLNKEGVLAFPMRYRSPLDKGTLMPGPKWNKFVLRGFNLSLLFYYKKGLIKKSRDAFVKIYGNSESEFVEKLYSIYRYDKSIKRK